MLPDDDTLINAYRRVVYVRRLNVEINRANAEAKKESESVEIPDELRQRVEQLIKEQPATSWDDALYQIADGQDGVDEQNSAGRPKRKRQS